MSALFSILSQNSENVTTSVLVGYEFPSLTEILDFIDRTACWPPPIRRADIRLWSGETGLHPGEIDRLAALLIGSEVAQ